jgi:hypothetical protein
VKTARLPGAQGREAFAGDDSARGVTVYHAGIHFGAWLTLDWEDTQYAERSTVVCLCRRRALEVLSQFLFEAI